MEQVVETKSCVCCQSQFHITDHDRWFYGEVAPVFQGVKYTIPDPLLCSLCRKKGRLSHRNLRQMHIRKCDATGKQIMSCYDENYPGPVYSSEFWWGDGWDPLSFGRDFDFNRPFFEQLHELFLSVPILDRLTLMCENCDFINGAANCKDCYLSFNMDYCEGCMYVGDITYSIACVDSFGLEKCELCYECTDMERCYNVLYSVRSVGCSDSYFLSDCRQCKNCIGCVNLIGKEYYIFNKKASKEEFEKYKEAFKSMAYVNDFKKRFFEFSMNYPRKHYFGYANEDFSGDNIKNARNSYDCYQCSEVENCKYCYYLFNANNCMDYDIFGDNSQWIYNCIATGYNCSNNICCMECWNGSSNNLYCQFISGASNNFGCMGIRQKQYCIFNKQYTKEEYEKLVPRIIENMVSSYGEAFPPFMSSFGYNETHSHIYFPLTKNEAEAQGYKWKDDLDFETDGNFEIDPNIPDNINETDDGLVNMPLTCHASGKKFKIIPQEMKFYKKQGVPVPHLHPEVRFKKRIGLRNPQTLWERTCGKCGVAIQTTYAPDRPEIVYCEKCYLESVE